MRRESLASEVILDSGIISRPLLDGRFWAQMANVQRRERQLLSYKHRGFNP
jgi:hypothetical protein